VPKRRPSTRVRSLARRRAAARARPKARSDELYELPGVGPATAAAIVNDREANGPFATVDDLARVRGIGEAKLAALRDLVTV
jgi:competence protein ComEA